MMKSKITKNGLINFPAKLRKKLKLNVGDEITFVETDEGFLVVPLKNILEATNPDEMDKAIEIIKELKEEHRNEA